MTNLVSRTFPQEDETPRATRKQGNMARLPTRFVDTLRDAVESDTYRTFVAGKPPTLAELLDATELLDGEWTVYGDGHYPTMRNGSRVIMWAAQWFGPRCDAAECERRWGVLDVDLRRAFEGGGLHSTPGTTGRALWLRTIPPGEGIETMTEESQRAVRAMSGQGRMEMFRPRWSQRGEHVVREYDQRWSYAALVRGLPIGEPEHLDGDAADVEMRGEYPTGKFLVEWNAGAWAHPFGILPQLGENGAEYPTSGAGWVDAVEVDLAVRCGWKVRATAALVWRERGDPLRTWSSRLEQLAERSAHEDWYRQAIRAIILHTIGAFTGAPGRRTEYGPEPPRGAERIRPLPYRRGEMRDRRAQRFAWSVPVPRSWPATHHPEWSSTIWARARRRLLDAPAGNHTRAGALYLPAGTLLAFRTDAIYTTAEPDWIDDGRPGRYRLKSAFRCERLPTNGVELLRARRRAAR